MSASKCAVVAALLVGSASAFMPTSGFLPSARFQGVANTGLRLRSPTIVPRKNVAAKVSMQATTTGQDTAALSRVATEARGLAMDSIAAAKSGHLGLPLGCAEVLISCYIGLRLSSVAPNHQNNYSFFPIFLCPTLFSHAFVKGYHLSIINCGRVLRCGT